MTKYFDDRRQVLQSNYAELAMLRQDLAAADSFLLS